MTENAPAPIHPIRQPEQLLSKIHANPALPALGETVFQVVQIASSDDEGIANLARFILSDVALTNKILSVANTMQYRTAARTPVTTISRAIYLMGFDAVKAIALAMLIVEGLTGKAAQLVRLELLQALGASLAGREIARRSGLKNVEETAVMALFKNLGRLLVALHDPVLYQEIMAESKTGDPVQASLHILGCSFGSIAESVLRSWKIPSSIINGLAPLPSGTIRPARSDPESLQQFSCFSADLASQLFSTETPALATVQHNLLARYGTALRLDANALNDLMRQVMQETKTIANAINLSSDDAHEQVTAPDKQILSEFLLMPDTQPTERETAHHPSGKPVNAYTLLLGSVQTLSEAISSRKHSKTDLMRLAVEALQQAMGFRFVALCQKDARDYYASVATGLDSAVRRPKFAFPLISSNNLFHLALQNNVDIVIADTSRPNVQNLLPGNYRQLTQNAASFVVLPLLVNSQPVGLIYADRSLPAPEGITPDEASLIKTLKAQLLAEIN